MLRAESPVVDVPTMMPMVQPIAGVPTRTDIAFTNSSGAEKGAIRTNAEKHLQKLAPVLLRLLGKDEFVVYVASACAPLSGLEQYTLGIFAQLVSRVTLVFTNMRILAFRVESKGDWRESLRVCALSDIKSAKLSGVVLTRYMKLQYASGKKESYWSLKLRDKSKLKTLMPRLLDPAFGSSTAAQGMHSLCPTCFADLTERLYECNACGQRFRDESSLWWRSFIPGAVYFYVKQTGMGMLHALVDGLLTFEVLMMLFAAATMPARERTTEFWIGAGFFFLLLLLERATALWHARRFMREFIPIPGTSRSMQAIGVSAGR